MSQVQRIRDLLLQDFPVSEWGDGVRVVTSCLYPSNGFVQVVIRGGVDTFVVSDEGLAFDELSAAGVEIHRPDALVKHLIIERGLSIRNGVISSPKVNASALGVSIALVANASKEIAEWLFSHSKIKRERDFKAIVQRFLRIRFNDAVRNEVLIGASNKSHKFENVIVLTTGNRLIIDPVIHDANSINARVVANLDVRSANYSDLEQRIVYDDDDNWKPDELNLLQVGAKVIPFSQASQVLGRIAVNG